MVRYFKHITVKSVAISQEEENLLNTIASALELIDDNIKAWELTNGRQTIHALSVVKSTLLQMSSALTSENFRLQRFAASIHGKKMSDFLTAIRSPRTTDEAIKYRVRQQRFKLQNCMLYYLSYTFLTIIVLIQILHTFWALCEGDNDDTFTKFINIEKKDLLILVKKQEEEVRELNVDVDIEDPNVTVVQSS